MGRRENPYHVVLVTDENDEVLGHVACSTLGAARKAEEESRAKDPWWWANYEIKPMTRSELAYLIFG